MTPSLSRRDFLLAAGLLSLGSGCRLQRPALAQRTFVLEPPLVEPLSDGPGAGVLLVRPFRVAPAFDSRPFIIRRGEAEYATDPYHLFLLPPGILVTEGWSRWIRDLGVFATVTTGGSQGAATHALEGEVMEIYGDYRDPARPLARLAMHVRLLHPWRGSSSPTAWQHGITQSVPLPHASADTLVAGWNQAFGAICGATEPHWRRIPAPAHRVLPGHPSPHVG